MRAGFRRQALSGCTFLSAVLCAALAASVTPSARGEDSSDPPSSADPQIVDYSVQVLPDDYGVRYIFSGRMVNCENISSPMVELVGYPFDIIAQPYSGGWFEIEFGFSGPEGDGMIICAFVLDNGNRVSPMVYTHT